MLRWLLTISSILPSLVGQTCLSPPTNDEPATKNVGFDHDTRDRSTRAAYHAKEGIQYANAEQYSLALAHFRAATRADPLVAKFWSDLGVTEMRMGMFDKSLRRYVKALKLDPSYSLAHDNIAELKKFMKEEDFNQGMLGEIQHKQQHIIKRFPRINAEQFRWLTIAADNGSMDSILNRPFVIKKALQSWGWDLDAFSLDRLQLVYGDSRVDYYPHNMNEEAVYPFFSSLSNAIHQLVDPLEPYEGVDASEPGTYIQWNLDAATFNRLLFDARGVLPALFDDSHWTQHCFPNISMLSEFYLKTHWKMLLIGESPAGMFNHRDTLLTSSWQVQLVGAKKWHVCAPSQEPYLYHAGDVDTFNPDYIKYPLFRKARCYQTILRPGDAIYYPKNYWHQTKNLDTPTISMTGTLATGNCHRDTFEELKHECAGRGKIFVPDPTLCAHIDHCAKLLEERFAVLDDSVRSSNAPSEISSDTGQFVAIDTHNQQLSDTHHEL